MNEYQFWNQPGYFGCQNNCWLSHTFSFFFLFSIPFMQDSNFLIAFFISCFDLSSNHSSIFGSRFSLLKIKTVALEQCQVTVLWCKTKANVLWIPKVFAFRMEEKHCKALKLFETLPNDRYHQALLSICTIWYRYYKRKYMINYWCIFFDVAQIIIWGCKCIVLEIHAIRTDKGQKNLNWTEHVLWYDIIHFDNFFWFEDNILENTVLIK